MLNDNKRVLYIDILNIIAIISVIALHHNGIVHGDPNWRAWKYSLVVECICYFAVPLFLLLTGANLMNYRKKYDTKTFFKKRFSKVVIPFIFWTIIMFVWKIYIIKSMQPFDNIKDLLNGFFSNKQESTYYFVWNIIGVYLTMPLLSILSERDNKKNLWFIVILYFIFNSLISNILPLIGINFNTNATVLLGGYTIFVIIGYLISQYDMKTKYRISIYIGAIVGLIYRYSTTFILSKAANSVVKITWGYTSWHSVLLAMAIFLIVKNIDFDKFLKSNRIKMLIYKIAGCSYGIYLIHKIIMYYEIRLLNINEVIWQWRTIGIFSTYVISLIIILLLRKVPLLKNIVA